jgi:hypothetical protein
MQPDPTIGISCDELLEFEEDAAAFANRPPEFVEGKTPAIDAALGDCPQDSPSAGSKKSA